MEYVKIKNADKIIESSSYLVKNPSNYKNKWNDLFGNNNKVCLELGMGRGDFIINMAKTYPNINFIGLEIVPSQMVNAIQKLQNMNLNNLKLINIDAVKLPEIFGKEIDTIYLTFCDPWPKKIDERKRFTHEGYLKIYDRIFKKDKHIILKTDNKGFFAYSLESLSNYWYTFDVVSLDLHHDERNIKNIMTDWERKCYQDKKTVFYLDSSFKN